jgi:hypothetical protein
LYYNVHAWVYKIHGSCQYTVNSGHGRGPSPLSLDRLKFLQPSHELGYLFKLPLQILSLFLQCQTPAWVQLGKDVPALSVKLEDALMVLKAAPVLEAIRVGMGGSYSDGRWETVRRVIPRADFVVNRFHDTKRITYPWLARTSPSPSRRGQRLRIHPGWRTTWQF